MKLDRYKKVDGYYTDEEGFSYEEIDQLLMGRLRFCGCGDGDAALEYVRSNLQDIKDGITRKSEKTGAQYFVWYWLDSEGFTDHGVSVPGWLTEKGNQLLEDLTEYLKTV